MSSSIWKKTCQWKLYLFVDNTRWDSLKDNTMSPQALSVHLYDRMGHKNWMVDRSARWLADLTRADDNVTDCPLLMYSPSWSTAGAFRRSPSYIFRTTKWSPSSKTKGRHDANLETLSRLKCYSLHLPVIARTKMSNATIKKQRQSTDCSLSTGAYKDCVIFTSNEFFGLIFNHTWVVFCQTSRHTPRTCQPFQ